MGLPKVDCRNVHHPGQIRVAVWRAVSIGGLRIINCSQRLLPEHPAYLTAFYEESSLPLLDDLTCCNASIHDEISGDGDSISDHDDDDNDVSNNKYDICNHK